MPRTSTLRTLLTAASATTLITLAGCGAGSGADEPGADEAQTVRNCDVDVSVNAPPERVYAAYQPAMEIAFALGQGDRLVGGGYPDAELLFEYSDAGEEAGVEITPSLPSRDALLAADPDFILSGYNNVFTAEGDGSSFGDRASLAELGVQSWILSPLCPSEDGLSDEGIDPATVTVQTIHEDVRALGELLGAQERAEEIIADQNERIAAVRDRVDGRVDGGDRPTVALLLLDDDGGLRAAGGIDFATRIIEIAGGENVFADLTERRHVDIDVEELISRDPDVIITDTCCEPNMTEENGAANVATIMDDPALAGMSAVSSDRVFPFLFANRAAGIRAAHASELMADLLHGDAS